MATVSFATDILPLFTQTDIAHMGAAPYNVMLAEYNYMSVPANAQNVYNYLTGTSKPQMPLGEPAWSQANLDLFNEWMQQGYQP